MNKKIVSVMFALFLFTCDSVYNTVNGTDTLKGVDDLCLKPDEIAGWNIVGED